MGMALALIIKGILMGLLVSVPPGPVGVMCIKRTMSRGIRSGVVSGIGAASADTLYSLVAGLGLSYVINFIQKEQFWIQLIGSLIIMAIAIKIFYSNPAIEFRNSRTRRRKPMEEFISVFLVTLSNPMVVFIFIAMFAGFNMLGENTNPLIVLFLVGGVFSGAMLWWFVLSIIINRFRNRIRLKNIWWMNKILGLIVFICGLVIIAKLYI
jgi:threonine/homoserine/homoserine lactone efflux protein